MSLSHEEINDILADYREQKKRDRPPIPTLLHHKAVFKTPLNHQFQDPVRDPVSARLRAMALGWQLMSCEYVGHEVESTQ